MNRQKVKMRRATSYTVADLPTVGSTVSKAGASFARETGIRSDDDGSEQEEPSSLRRDSTSRRDMKLAVKFADNDLDPLVEGYPLNQAGSEQPLAAVNETLGKQGSTAWASTVDPATGKTYYYNKMRRTTSWNLPDLATLEAASAAAAVVSALPALGESPPSTHSSEEGLDRTPDHSIRSRTVHAVKPRTDDENDDLDGFGLGTLAKGDSFATSQFSTRLIAKGLSPKHADIAAAERNQEFRELKKELQQLEESNNILGDDNAVLRKQMALLKVCEVSPVSILCLQKKIFVELLRVCLCWTSTQAH
jgi:hypothetical protein